MLLLDLQQAIHPLHKREKVQLLHFLVDELAQEQADVLRELEPGATYPIWSPYNEYAAADQLLKLAEGAPQ